MNKLYLPLILVLVAALSSCGALRVEKRHYRNGFYVDFNKNQHKTAGVDHQAQAAVEPVIRDVNPDPVNEAKESPKAEENVLTSEQHAVQPAKVTEQPQTIEVNVPSVDQPSPKDQQQEQTQESPAGAADSDVMLIVLIILAIIIPPLAVYLKEGLTGRFWLILILSILGGGFFFYPVFGGLWLLAVILALLIVLDIM
jgi:uncharacterized membrane protein YqaE (UPF0057 family)